MLRDYRLDEVLVKDAYCANAYDKDVAYLLSLDTDRLLAGFYENAGLTPKKMRYSGWENMLIGGHTLGHYLTAAAQGYANAAADDEQKNGLFSKIKALADGLSECQDHSQGKPGFVFGATISDINNVELQFDLVEQGKTNIITESWVPWYTVHKILDGLVNAYKLTGYEPALKVASGIGDWTFNRAATWSEETHKTVLGIEYGGINDALYELYMITRKEEHLKAAHAFDEEDLFKKIASGEKNALNNRHANTTIPKFLGALNRYITLGEEASEYLEYVKAFWDMVVEKHTYVTGGNSENEHFGEDSILDVERTHVNNETCNTHNMLKLSRRLFAVTGDKKYLDYAENTLINAIMASQNHDTGFTTYFQPMATGYQKVFNTLDGNFWCCTGTGYENFTKLQRGIYYTAPGKLLVAMYLASEYENEDYKLVMDCDLTASDEVKLTIAPKDGKTLKDDLLLFIPTWVKGKMTVAIGDKCLEAEPADKFIEIKAALLEEAGKCADKAALLEITLPMGISCHNLPDGKDTYAFCYGPYVLSARLGNKKIKETTHGVRVSVAAEKAIDSDELKITAESSVKAFIDNIDKHLVKREGTCEFDLKDVSLPLVFTTHFNQYTESYGIYWKYVVG